MEGRSDLPWIEKYRPKDLSEMIDHAEKIKTIRKMIQTRELPHLLFYGTPGSGKTSLILATAREMYGENYRSHILELNASDNRGIDIVRSTIPEFIKVRSNHLRLVILDEVDAMTADAQRALRRVMENNIKNSRFCLICNNITRIIPGVQSRCVKMRFGYLQPGEIRKKVDYIIRQERVNIDTDAVNLLIELNKDFRQILNSLQCLHSIRIGMDGSSYKNIDENDVYEYMGKPTNETVEEVFQLMFTDFNQCYNKLKDMFKRNEWNLLDLLDAFSEKIIKANELTDAQRLEILKSLSEIEYRVVNGRDSDIQLASLIASVKTA